MHCIILLFYTVTVSMAQYIKLLRELIIKRLAVFISVYDRLFKKSAVSGCNLVVGNIVACAYNAVKYR